VVGIVALAGGTGDPARAFTFKPGVNVPVAVLAGAAIAFYACLGFEDVANVAEEAQNPSGCSRWLSSPVSGSRA
jgi:basic amino acid/polyamine antiporter, APA family